MTTLKNILESADKEKWLEEGILNEAGLSRIKQHSDKPFAVITAFRNNYSLKENRKRNKQLESTLKANKAGGIKLIGHWQEGPDGMDWREAKKLGRVEDIVEESYFVPKPKDMEFEQFFTIMAKLTKKFDQDVTIISDGDDIMFLYQNGDTEKKYKSTQFMKIDQAYSQLRNRPGVPFIFEGTMAPSSNMHRMALKERGVIWLSQLEENQ
jgi:hypothetical protein